MRCSEETRAAFHEQQRNGGQLARRPRVASGSGSPRSRQTYSSTARSITLRFSSAYTWLTAGAETAADVVGQHGGAHPKPDEPPHDRQGQPLDRGKIAHRAGRCPAISTWRSDTAVTRSDCRPHAASCACTSAGSKAAHNEARKSFCSTSGSLPAYCVHERSRGLHARRPEQVHDEDGRARRTRFLDRIPEHERLVQVVQQAVADDRVVGGQWQRRAGQDAFDELHAAAQLRRLVQALAGELQHRGRAVEAVHDETGMAAGQAQHDVARAAAQVEHRAGVHRGKGRCEVRDEAFVRFGEIGQRVGARLLGFVHELGFGNALHVSSTHRGALPAAAVTGRDDWRATGYWPAES